MVRPSTPSYGRSHTRRAFHWSRRGPWNAAIVPSGARGGPYVNGILQFETSTKLQRWLKINPDTSITRRTTWWKPIRWSTIPSLSTGIIHAKLYSNSDHLEPQPIVYFKLRISLSLRSLPMMTSETAFFKAKLLIYIHIYNLTCYQNTFISIIWLASSCN